MNVCNNSPELETTHMHSTQDELNKLRFSSYINNAELVAKFSCRVNISKLKRLHTVTPPMENSFQQLEIARVGTASEGHGVMTPDIGLS